jgi:hypothetical protein
VKIIPDCAPKLANPFNYNTAFGGKPLPIDVPCEQFISYAMIVSVIPDRLGCQVDLSGCTGKCLATSKEPNDAIVLRMRGDRNGHVNQTSCQPLLFFPILVCIEDTAPDDRPSGTEGRVCLAVWTAAWHERMEALAWIVVSGHELTLFFPCDNVEETQIVVF